MLFWLPVYILLVDKTQEKYALLPTPNGATKKEIGRAKEYIVKQLGLETKDLFAPRSYQLGMLKKISKVSSPPKSSCFPSSGATHGYDRFTMETVESRKEAPFNKVQIVGLMIKSISTRLA